MNKKTVLLGLTLVIALGFLFVYVDLMFLAKSRNGDITLQPQPKTPQLPLPSSSSIIINSTMLYWHPKSVTPKPINTARYLVFEPWAAGINNRRMSLETVYIMAFLTNRTLVLPMPYVQYPYSTVISYTDMYDPEHLKAAIPVVEFAEWTRLYAQYHIDWKTTSLRLPWTDIPSQQTSFIFPALPKEGTPAHEKMKAWRTARTGTIYHPNSVPGFDDAPVIYFPDSVVFTHFYVWFFFP